LEQTIYSALCAAGRRSSSSAALLGISRKILHHCGLVEQIEQTVHALNQAGIGRGDKVAIVLGNGPDAASCNLAVAAAATAAPLNIGCTASQFQEHFSALGVDAVIVENGSDSAAKRVAEEMGIPVIRLFAERHMPAGVFSLEAGNRKKPKISGFAAPEDVAFLMHTSGSTSRPKIVPLTHLNFCSGATNNATHLELTADDRCLCVTGMFYTQGILVSVFSPLMMGGSTVCTPGYDPLNFFAWLDEFRPTWYAAPTTIQRSILNRAPLHSEVVSRSRIRVIRSSSAPADSDLIAQVEDLFRAPMLDSYGMTETSSTIAGEPLAHAKRKPGSVGIAVGCEVAAVDEHDVFLQADEIGEIVVRGPGVIKAYEGEACTNQRSFLNGWLRTGDLGKIDPDGYVFLTGRIKELINRGGEKISPVYIDDAFHAHPAVAEAMTFALPDKNLGEEIAVAVVLRDGFVPSRQFERHLQEFAASRLTGQRQPRKIVFVKEIPKAATGKSLRIGLAEKLGLAGPVHAGRADRPLSGSARPEDAGLPSSMVEMLLLHIWEDTLGRSPVGIHEDFFDLGGDSLLATQLMIRIEDTFRRKLSISSLFEAPTVESMTSLLLESPSNGYNFGASNVIAVRTAGSQPPLFILGLQPLFHPLIRCLSGDIPVFGLSFPDPATLSLPFRMEEIASRQVEALRRFHPHGPYALAGWCADGILAYEMAQQLRAQGQEVLLVAMMDACNPATKYERRWNARLGRLRFHGDMLTRLSFKSGITYIAERIKTLKLKLRRQTWRMLYRMHLVTERRVGDRLRVSEQILTVAASQYVPRTYDGRVLSLRAEIRPHGPEADAAFGWRDVAPNLRVVDVPGNHRDIFRASNVGVMASALEESFDCVLAATGGR
jgi:acyl-CoA synthetase (AMP-forming)/AMP-acid ligase II/thioesterase domain-containing protein/acyl carrier protein